ncbi:MAG TPA: SH3 domain-containing protein [Bacillota bacterium]|jgi:hypothetical protein|nr:SH3 domain-containing protein [Bacillota bacterium]HOL10978.1 SH3 domain-containing protein [Bacillota bacterium]HPO98047.1 SH3 domain-containing protein [Bacillota bacterium]
MRKKYSIFGISILLLLAVNISVAALPVRTMDNTRLEMFDPDYWIEKIDEQNKVIMTLAEIQDYNREIIRQLPNVTYDLASFPAKFSKEALFKHVDIPFPKTRLFIRGKELTDEYIFTLRERLNLDAIKEVNEVKYGFTVKRANLKMFPTHDIISDAANDPAFDQFQYTAVLAYEPVLVLHQSLDQQWFYIYMYNCTGWVPATAVAICPDKESWLKAQQLADNQFLVVTANKIKLDVNLESPEVSELELSMGTILPLAPETEIPSLIDGRAPYDGYVVKLLVRNQRGELDHRFALVPVSKDVSLGYLKFTRQNVIRQVFKMHGDRYGWGGMLNARDCSSLVLETYRCFGFRLPRNTASQAKCPGRTLNFVGLSIKEREAMLGELGPGAALYFPGHTMIYIGKDQGRYYVISALGTFGNNPGDYQTAKSTRTRTVVINELNLKRVNGQSWLEALTVGKQFETIKFTDLDGYSKKQLIEDYANRLIIAERAIGKFEPSALMTQAEFVSVLTKIFKVDQQQLKSSKYYSPNREVDYQYLESVVIMLLKDNGLFKNSFKAKKVVSNILKVNETQEKLNKKDCLTRYEIIVILDNLKKYINQSKK